MRIRGRALPTLAMLPVVALVACAGGPPSEYRLATDATACERQEWAEERVDLLEAGDTAEAGRFASSRCFRVDSGRRVREVSREGGMPWGGGRWIEVETVDGGALEHLASAELRRATGLSVRTSGWVRGEDLQEIQ